MNRGFYWLGVGLALVSYTLLLADHLLNPTGVRVESLRFIAPTVTAQPPVKHQLPTIKPDEARNALLKMIAICHPHDEMLKREAERLKAGEKPLQHEEWLYLANTKWHPSMLRFVITFFDQRGIPIIEFSGDFHKSSKDGWQATVTKMTRGLR